MTHSTPNPRRTKHASPAALTLRMPLHGPLQSVARAGHSSRGMKVLEMEIDSPCS